MKTANPIELPRLRDDIQRAYDSLISERFGAEYVFTDSAHTDFMQVVEDSGDFEKVYEDKFATVLRVRKPDEPRPKKEEGEDAQ